MAKRPIFYPASSGDQLFETEIVDFRWFAGLSLSQARRSVRSLHESLKGKRPELAPTLEVSSRSEVGLGRNLSAFSLQLALPDGTKTSVESAYQGSKLFSRGGPYVDLYAARNGEARGDLRLRASGELIGFRFFGQEFTLSPPTLFYDWLYIQALSAAPALAEGAAQFRSYSDIAFNPKRSVACQARSVATYGTLLARGGYPGAGLGVDRLRSVLSEAGSSNRERQGVQGELF